MASKNNGDPLRNIDLVLAHWARWKQTYVIGLNYASKTIEYKLMAGDPLGDGCVGGGPDKSMVGVQFAHDPVAMTIDTIIIRLSEYYRREVIMLRMVYLMGWSVRRISQATKVSRREAGRSLDRAKGLVYTHFDLRLRECGEDVRRLTD